MKGIELGRRNLGVPLIQRRWDASSTSMRCGPSLVAKHFLPFLVRDQKALFAALSARVASIEDNRLGGWLSYRAAKASLNMAIKTLSIELARRNPTALCVGLHPGTVDTPLSWPFQASVQGNQLMAPSRSVQRLSTVMDRLTVHDSGQVFDWRGSRVAP